MASGPAVGSGRPNAVVTSTTNHHSEQPNVGALGSRRGRLTSQHRGRGERGDLERRHPYQGSAPGLVSQDGTFDLGERCTAGDRWRPLRTARLRWHVDQTWTRHARSRGQRRSASRTLPGKETPAGCPRQASPARAIALLGGALAGSGPGTSPYIGGLSLATSMVVPQPPLCSNHAHDGGWLGPHDRSRLMRAIRPLSINPA
jgi:hypothetical protein